MSAALLEWKEEPVSPLTEEPWASEETLYLTGFEHADFKVETENDEEACETKAEIASKLLDNLDQLEDLDEWIKSEEPFHNWLDDKMLPILEDVEPPHCLPPMPNIKIEQMKPAVVPDTRLLLREFETVLDAVEMTHGTLTPPQSPPYEQPILTTLQTIPAQSIYPLEEKQLVYQNISLECPSTPQPDVARELAAVEELVRARVEDMVHWSGPCSPSSSSSSNFGDCSSSDDPEWIPDLREPDAPPLEKPPRKRSKPYSRTSPEDKKSRKKEQNKNAATRYRLKKKAEVEEILEEERGLQKRNEELENQIGDVKREIKYLKGLMRDLFRAKGLIQ